MKGRNRRQRLSDPMKSVLWYMARGFEVFRSTRSDGRGAFVARPDAPVETRMAISLLVAEALEDRELIERAGELRGQARLVLTAKGAELASEIRNQIEGRAVSHAG